MDPRSRSFAEESVAVGYEEPAGESCSGYEERLDSVRKPLEAMPAAVATASVAVGELAAAVAPRIEIS